MKTIARTKKNILKYIYMRMHSIVSKSVKNNISFIVFNLISSVIHDSRINKDTILIINTEFMGDIITSFELINSLSEKCQTVFIFDERYSEFLKRFELNTQLFPIDKGKYRKNIFYRIRVIQKLRNLSSGVSINVSPSRGFINDELTLLSSDGIKYAVCEKSIYLLSFYNRFLNSKYDEIISSGIVNIIDKQRELINKLGVYPNSVKSSVARKEISSFDIPDLPITIAPFPHDISRGYPLKHWSKLFRSLSEENVVQVVGACNQTKYLDNCSITSSNFINMVGKTKMDELPEIISNSKLFIGVDSGLTHLAIYLGVPTIALIGGGMFNKYFPHDFETPAEFFYKKLDCFGCYWRCKFKEKYCLTEIEIEEVIKTAKTFLRHYNRVI